MKPNRIILIHLKYLIAYLKKKLFRKKFYVVCFQKEHYFLNFSIFKKSNKNILTKKMIANQFYNPCCNYTQRLIKMTYLLGY